MNANLQPSGSAYFIPDVTQAPERHTLSVLVANEPGILARIAGLFSARGFNIDSLTVSETEHEKGLSRLTIVTTANAKTLEQIKMQLGRLVPVHKVHDLTVEGESVERELALVKGRRYRRTPRRNAPHRRRLPGPGGRCLHRQLRVRDHRKVGQGRAVHQADGAARTGRGGSHRHGCHLARQGKDVSAPQSRFMTSAGRLRAARLRYGARPGKVETVFRSGRATTGEPATPRKSGDGFPVRARDHERTSAPRKSGDGFPVRAGRPGCH